MCADKISKAYTIHAFYEFLPHSVVLFEGDNYLFHISFSYIHGLQTTSGQGLMLVTIVTKRPETLPAYHDASA